MTAAQKTSYNQVKCLYASLRQTSLEAAHDGLPPVLRNKRGVAIIKNSIFLDQFTFKSQLELKRWENSGLRRVAWNWDAVQKKYRTHPKRFELTVWYRGQTLCGASIGRPTWSGGKLRLDYIEASPMGTPLDGLVTDIAIAASNIYADSIGATQIRIMNPVNTDVRNHYLSKPGFSYNERDDYCYLDLV
ncbi:hypothetical protein [Teredinibacter turnerae]|uniref:hypothetical protein n=1 Tax=Teredinibacter turnerae TaxID=2426 RepID=UPI0030D2C8D1